ncbi:MAG: GNAT family N-acetyltransferase [Oscillospiraceae bacterium]|nr:GNAT family N-acetyltransferase [Oscillospiraceae bacterium]
MGMLDAKAVRREIARYSALPVIFDGFHEAKGLGDDSFGLVCVEKLPADIIRGYSPSYNFTIKARGIRVGAVSLRVGYTRSLFYSGQIGYAVDAPFRGQGYAGRACRLMTPLMRAHGMTKVLITNNPDNIASRRVCEKLGARLLCVAKIPRTHELYRAGDRYKNIFEWDIEQCGCGPTHEPTHEFARVPNI